MVSFSLTLLGLLCSSVFCLQSSNICSFYGRFSIDLQYVDISAAESILKMFRSSLRGVLFHCVSFNHHSSSMVSLSSLAGQNFPQPFPWSDLFHWISAEISPVVTDMFKPSCVALIIVHIVCRDSCLMPAANGTLIFLNSVCNSTETLCRIIEIYWPFDQPSPHWPYITHL